MATQTLTATLDSHAPSAKRQTATRPASGKSVWRRMLEAMIEAQQRRADLEIQHCLRLTGQTLPHDIGSGPSHRTTEGQA